MAKDLKQNFDHIRIDDGELESYRGNLASNLPRRMVFPSKALLVIPLAAALLMYLTLPDSAFRQETPEEVIAFVKVAESPVDLGRRALARLESPKPQDHLNAIAILCLTQKPEDAIQMAAKGLLEDPRPAFRAFYLEFLLDNADEHRFNPDLIENLMDKEVDRHCLSLFKDLFKLAV